MNKEYIVCSAINYKGQVVTGISCGAVIDTVIDTILFFEKKPDSKQINSNQGFITSTGRFVDRTEAYYIAKENDQIKFNIREFKEDAKPFLMSINLY